MRIKAIAPIWLDGEELARRQGRYDRLSPPGITIVLVNLPDGADVPRRLENEDDLVASDRLVAEEALETDPAEFDAVMPDCVLDPGVPTILEDGRTPVFGILKLSAGLLHAMDQPFSAVARNQVIAGELQRCVERYGYATRFDGVDVLDLSFQDIADDAKWHGAVAEVRDRRTRAATRTILNGCSAVEVTDDDHPVAVIDPTRLALRLIAIAIEHAVWTPRGPRLAAV